MTIEAKAWKNFVNEKHIYVIQFASGSVKETRDICETLNDWKQTGVGFDKKGLEVLIFSKDFKDTQAWIEWAKMSPFVISEVDREGAPKRVQTNVVLVDDGRRKCSKCNKSGHNSATCGKQNTKIKTLKVKGKKICGNCGGIGHNKRTCKSPGF